MSTFPLVSHVTQPISISTAGGQGQSDLEQLGPQSAGEEQLLSFEEKREYPRIPFRGRAKAVVFPAPSSPAGTTLHDSEVVTSDLSRGGVSILNRTPLTPGQQLLLMLNDRNQLAEVRWCCPVWDGLFAAGCRFIGEPGATNIDQQLMAIDVVISSEESWWLPEESA
jgi:hypothetical protein